MVTLVLNPGKSKIEGVCTSNIQQLRCHNCKKKSNGHVQLDSTSEPYATFVISVLLYETYGNPRKYKLSSSFVIVYSNTTVFDFSRSYFYLSELLRAIWRFSSLDLILIHRLIQFQERRKRKSESMKAKHAKPVFEGLKQVSLKKLIIEAEQCLWNKNRTIPMQLKRYPVISAEWGELWVITYILTKECESKFLNSPQNI